MQEFTNKKVREYLLFKYDKHCSHIINNTDEYILHYRLLCERYTRNKRQIKLMEKYMENEVNTSIHKQISKEIKHVKNKSDSTPVAVFFQSEDG